MSCAIKVENLGKKYIIQHQQQSRYQYNSLGELLTRSLKKAINPIQDNIKSQTTEEFWALKNINFEINHGDRVGIVGRNGAGKSTLLKILSRITHPTTGKISINGRVSSLLEVGTGFHPELTGRENIFLNGAILGMRKQEIQSKFDEIVDFAEVEKFLDTPVKHYSSGMYVRLAFAVAAHLEPDILIIDEVLAVGDTQFQNKCFQKIQKNNYSEKTIIFVSHDLKTIRSLCDTGIYLENGLIKELSTSQIIVDNYIKSTQIAAKGFWKKNYSQTKEIFFEEISVKNRSFQITNIIPSTEQFYIEIKIQSIKTLDNAQIHIRFTNSDGVAVVTTANVDSLKQQSITRGQNEYRVTIPANFLQHGIYTLIFAVMIVNVQMFDEVRDEISFKIEDFGNHSTTFREGRKCVVTPIFEWKNL